MDSMEINKVFAAVLTVGIAFMGATLLADGLVESPAPKTTAIKIEGVGAPVLAVSATEAPLEPISPLLASADPARGAADTQKLCSACHSFNEGGKAGVGSEPVRRRRRAAWPHGGLPVFVRHGEDA